MSKKRKTDLWSKLFEELKNFEKDEEDEKITRGEQVLEAVIDLFDGMDTEDIKTVLCSTIIAVCESAELDVEDYVDDLREKVLFTDVMFEKFDEVLDALSKVLE